MVGSGGADLRAPVFNGDNFDFWKIRMKTIFRSHELWDIVEKGFDTPAKKDEELTVAESKLLNENIVRDAKALGIIQGAVSDQIFPRIAIQETANAAWNVLKQEFVGDKQVQAVKLQGLRRDFEYTRMGENEAFSAYLVRLFDLISQMRSYGEDISNQRIVQKLLISLPRSSNSIAYVIENIKDLDTVDVQDVVAILKGYEQQIDRHDETHTEKAFVSLIIAPKQNKYNENQGFKPQKNWKSKFKKGDNRSTNQTGKVAGTSKGAKNPCIHCDKLHFGECWFKDKPRCHNCHKLGHIARDCRGKKEKANQHVNFVNQVNDTPTMFYVCNNVTVKKSEDIWYVDSGCSNHMTGREDLLVDIDRTITAKGNTSFPLRPKPEMQVAMKAGVYQSSTIWHRRLGHLNLGSLKQLKEHDMVLGLPDLEMTNEICEGCALGKHCRDAFPKEASWRASLPLELIHSDICGPM
ncbi:unnamed protein product [Malus baccata var. baccata]